MCKRGVIVLEKLISWNLFCEKTNLKFESGRRGKGALETMVEIEPNEGEDFFITGLF